MEGEVAVSGYDRAVMVDSHLVPPLQEQTGSHTWVTLVANLVKELEKVDGCLLHLWGFLLMGPSYILLTINTMS